MIETIGIDNTIHIIQNKLAHITIAIKTENGDIDKFFHITYGTSRLFSVCCINMYNEKIIIVAFNHSHNPIASAGISAINGQIYGTNSIIHAITDNIKNSSTTTQNNLIINNHINVSVNILNHNINWPFIQSVRDFKILSSLFNKYLEVSDGITS